MINIYSIYDVKSDAYMTPFYARTNGEAERMLLNTADNPDTQFHKYPLDFVLCFIGVWDDLKGTLVSKPVEELGSVFYLQRVEKARYEHAETELKELEDANRDS